MQHCLKTLSAGLVAACAAFSASADSLVTEDVDFAFDIDTRTSFVVSSLAAATPLPYWSGDTLTIVQPGGTSATPVSSAATDGSYGWTPSCGGTWTITNDCEGVATFRVYYSLFPASVGEGTVNDPLKVVDGDDLSALVSGGYAVAGKYFSPEGVEIGRIVQPAGYAFSEKNGIFLLVASVDGLLYVGADVAFLADTRLPGPDRKMKKSESMPLAYSGDLWTGTNAAATATLTIYDPSGTSAAHVVSGWDSVVFAPDVAGEYTITLSDGDTTLTSLINVAAGGFILTVR